MSFAWETDKERILRHMKISPVKKLEWLRSMNEFLSKSSSRKKIARLRELRDQR
ncbi:MAG: hypothetical protein KAI43_08310 [Candidatus Aureabacteria bacterium]|nr:hypothetical protein [Candidatus Auribacterota bacterium]